MKRMLLRSSAIVVLMVACGFDDAGQPDRVEPSIAERYWGDDPVWQRNWPTLPEKLPRNSRIHRLLSAKIPMAVVDVPADVRERELKFTTDWMREFCRHSISKSPRVQFATAFERDEAVLIEARIRTLRLRVIDSRSLDIAFLATAVEKRTLEENFREFVDPFSFDGNTPITVLEHVDCGIEGEFKRISLKPGRFGPIRPFEVFQCERVFIVSCEKVVTRPAHMIRWRPEQYVGGLPLEDERPWRRFLTSNRQQLSEEYREKWAEEFRLPVVPGDPHEIKNRVRRPFEAKNSPVEPVPTSPPSSDTKSAPDAI
jgi:hypothetical protein